MSQLIDSPFPPTLYEQNENGESVYEDYIQIYPQCHLEGGAGYYRTRDTHQPYRQSCERH